MTDYTELKRLAEGAVQAGDHWGLRDSFERQLAKLVDPETVLALIAENERLVEDYDKAWRHDLNDKNNVQALAAEVARLSAKNRALLSALKGLTSMYGYCWDLVDGGLCCMPDNVQRFEDAHEAARKLVAAMGKGEQS